jgi:hypothetical protein
MQWSASIIVGKIDGQTITMSLLQTLVVKRWWFSTLFGWRFSLAENDFWGRQEAEKRGYLFMQFFYNCTGTYVLFNVALGFS